MPVKENQPALRADIERLLERSSASASASASANRVGLAKPRVLALGESQGWPPLRVASSCQLAHGRIEERELRAVEVPAEVDPVVEWLPWPGRRQVFALTRKTRFKKSGQERCETILGITSLALDQADAATLLAMVRSHWQIENGLHWVACIGWLALGA